MAGLLHKATLARLSIDELYKNWPGAMEDKPALSVLFDDTLDGVEHTPVPAQRDFWRTSREYWLMYLDLELIRQAGDAATILACRLRLEDSLGPWRELTAGAVDRAIAQCLRRLSIER
jgi:hypothetical protein